MIKFTVRTDCHVHDKAPQSRVDDYLATCMSSLAQIGDYATQSGSDAVLDNGDFFHAKAATKNSHALMRAVIDIHSEHYPLPVLCNPGNHDFPYNRIEYLDRQPLGVLFAAKVFERMTDRIFVSKTDPDFTVRVVGLPYKRDFSVEDFNIKRGEEDYLVVCAHTFASLEGGQIYGSEYALPYIDLAGMSPDVFVFGHWHQDQGIQKVQGKTFMNLGSMTRGSLTQDNINRIPRFGFLEFSRGSVKAKAIELDVPPASEVFDLQKHSRLEREDNDIETFIASLLHQVAGSEDEKTIASEIEALTGFQKEVRDVALRYLHDVAHGKG